MSNAYELAWNLHVMVDSIIKQVNVGKCAEDILYHITVARHNLGLTHISLWYKLALMSVLIYLYMSLYLPLATHTESSAANR